MEHLVSGARKLGFELTPRQLEQFDSYYQELGEWNKRLNLTSITGFKEVQLRHFLDSLTVTLAGGWPSGVRVIDVGAGAGLPGLPLKILFADMKLWLLEATAKKAKFLLHLRKRLGLNDVEVIVGRAEEIAHQDIYREQFDLALSRAVARLPALVELTLPFLKIGGRLIAQKKGNIDPELEQAAGAIKLMGGRLLEVKGVGLAELSDRRWLIVIEKQSPTPERYPRRPGMPAKRPIIKAQLLDEPGD